jgi:hypothetical protein
MVTQAKRAGMRVEAERAARLMRNDRRGCQIAAAADKRKIDDFHTELRFVDTRYASSDPFGLE